MNQIKFSFYKKQKIIKINNNTCPILNVKNKYLEKCQFSGNEKIAIML